MEQKTAVNVIVGAVATSVAVITIAYVVNNVKLSKSLDLNTKAAKLHYEREQLLHAATKRADQMIIDEIFDNITKKDEKKD